MDDDDKPIVPVRIPIPDKLCDTSNVGFHQDPVVYRPDDSYNLEDWQSETTSIASSLYRGSMDNGRRYQTLRASGSFVPSDDQQFDAYEAGHIVALLMDSHRDNPLFRSPIGAHPEHIVDIGTGKGSWPIDVADMFPNATVRGVDLFPPPVSWIPPNCILEVDDVLQKWTWQQPFDLIHMRIMDGALTLEENASLFKEIYKNLRPGGWVENLSLTPELKTDDGSVPSSAPIFTWGKRTSDAARKMGRPLELYEKCPEMLKAAGFVDIKVQDSKWPIGPWARDKQLKEAGLVNAAHWATGFEGYGMYLLTKFGDPVPWSKEEVQVYVANLRKDIMNPRYHLYHGARRVWARKPFPDEMDISGPRIKQESPDIKHELSD